MAVGNAVKGKEQEILALRKEVKALEEEQQKDEKQ
jgi:hypothetical protein